MNVSVHGLKNEIYSCVTPLFSYSCVLKTRLLNSDHGLKNEVYSCVTRLFSYSCVLKHAYFGSWIKERGIVFIFMCIKNTLISVHGLKNEVYSCVTRLFSYSCVLKTRLFRFMD